MAGAKTPAVRLEGCSTLYIKRSAFVIGALVLLVVATVLGPCQSDDADEPPTTGGTLPPVVTVP